MARPQLQKPWIRHSWSGITACVLVSVVINLPDAALYDAYKEPLAFIENLFKKTKFTS